MPKIDYLIPPQNFEIVRQRIGEIIADELSHQVVLDTDSGADINARVWMERAQAFSHTEMPAINVLLAKSGYDNGDANVDDGTYTFEIDVYACAKADADSRGDFLAALKMQRMCGIVRTIFTDQAYRTLGFAPPYIERVSVVGMNFPDPLPVQDTLNVVMGRVTLTVRVNEDGKAKDPELIGSYTTQIKLETTNKGYYLKGINY